MKTVLENSDKSLVCTVEIHHNRENLVLRPAKDAVVLTFDQFRTLYEDVNFYNQINPLHIKG